MAFSDLENNLTDEFYQIDGTRRGVFASHRDFRRGKGTAACAEGLQLVTKRKALGLGDAPPEQCHRQ